MKNASLVATTALAFAALIFSMPATAEENAVGSDEDSSADEVAAPSPKKGPRDSARESRRSLRLPQNAAAALARASAAYDYGDMNQMVEAARQVAEGSLTATPWEEEQAFRLLGIGLYLTNRPLGAETAFAELLRKNPKARLDPTTTRPEVVAFFENLRHKDLARQRSHRKVFWNFIPPVGQFQYGDNVRGWIVLGVGVASLATFATSDLLLRSWQQQDKTMPGHDNTAPTVKAANWISCGVLAATYIYGVFDGLIGYGKPLDESKPPVSLFLLPGGGGLGFTF
jgi:hypothetical protein